MDDVIGPACDKGAVRARKDAAPRDPTLGRWAPGTRQLRLGKGV
jgi:hypothetical protein